MTHHRPKPLVLALAAGVFSLVACSDRASDDAARREADAAVEKTAKAAAAAADKTAEMAELARDKTRAFVTSPQVKQDAAAVKNAIKGAGAAAVATVDDAAITLEVTRALARDAELSASRIDVETKGGVVHLAGPAPSAAAKARAGELAGSVRGVATVDNALEVQAM